MTQEWLVGVIVVVAACYAVWHWLPARLRRRLLGRVQDEASAGGSGCGACSSCGDGSCAPPPRSDWREVRPPVSAPRQGASSGDKP